MSVRIFLCLSLYVLQIRSEQVCLTTTKKSSAEVLTGRVTHMNHKVAVLQRDVSKIKTDAEATIAALATAYADLQDNQEIASSSLAYQLRTKPTDCIQPQSCSTCTNGSLVLRCIDGLLQDKELQLCEDAGLALPHVLSLGAELVRQDPLAAEYAIDHIISCCLFQSTLTECICEDGFESQSLCSRCSLGHGGQNCTACPLSSDGTLCAGHGTCNHEGKCECFDGFDGDDCSACKQGFGGPACLPCDQNRLVFEGKTLETCCPSTYNCTCDNSMRGCDGRPAPIDEVKACLLSSPHNYIFVGSSETAEISNVTYYLFSHWKARTWMDTFFRVFQCGGQLATIVYQDEYTPAQRLSRGGGNHAWTGGRLRTGFSAYSVEGWGWIDSGGVISDYIDPEVIPEFFGISHSPRYQGAIYSNSGSGYWSASDNAKYPSVLVESGRCPKGYFGKKCSTCPISTDGEVCAGHGTCNDVGKCECFDGFGGDDCATCKKGFGGPSCLPCDPNRLVFEGESYASCCPSTYNCTCENIPRGCDGVQSPIHEVKACLMSPPHNYIFAGSSETAEASNVTYYLFSHAEERTWMDTFFRVLQCGGQMAWILTNDESTAATQLVMGGGYHAWSGGRLRTGFSSYSVEGWGWIDSGGFIWDVVDLEVMPSFRTTRQNQGSIFITSGSGYHSASDWSRRYSVVVESGRKRRCHEGYYGEHCLPCPGTSFADISCFGHGECDADSGVCVCAFGYSGDACDECLEDFYGSDCDPCPIDCTEHGACSDGVTGNGSCICQQGWTGTNCDRCVSNFYGDNCTACLCEHGTCLDSLIGNGSCMCNEGWNGTVCDECALGFYGSNCLACRNCSGHGLCNDGITGHGCECSVSFLGTTCDVQKVLAPDGAAYDRLGASGASLSANGEVLAASAYRGDDNGDNSGSLHIWRWNSTIEQFVHIQKLLAYDGAADDSLTGVALSEDGNVLASASPGDDDNGENSGSLYVWRWNATDEQFIFLQKLLASDGAADDRLGGASLSAVGNVLAATAVGNDDNGEQSGSLYVWHWNSTSERFFFLQKLLAPDGASGDQLGHGGASLSGDGSVLAAGAHYESSTTGSVYVWRWNSTTEQFCFLQKLFAPDRAAGDWLGFGGAALSVDGSVLVAGAHYDDDQGSSSGSLYVWRWNSSSQQFVYLQKLVASDGAADDNLGWGGASLSGDGSVLTAGAHWDGDNGVGSGCLYVWRWDFNTERFVLVRKLLAPDGAEYDNLGHDGGSWSADGRVLAAAASYDHDNGVDSGSLYVWYLQ